uniref:Uncharacterized protein n=1 Tax=Panagrolaimus sp. PS1159 TaxID=55785 RepID=A0AC35EVP2_9BILA
MRPLTSFWFIASLIFFSLIFVVHGESSAVTSVSSDNSDIEFSKNETQNEPYYICGKNGQQPSEGVNCYCSENKVECSSHFRRIKPLKNANIQLLISNFTVEYVDIEEQNFGILKKDKTLPDIAKNVKILQLSFNNITMIEDGTFDKFDNLENLILNSNKIQNMSSKVLTEKLGSKLKHLNLNDNKVSLSSLNFTYLTNLNSLSLGFNQNIGKELTSSSTWEFPKELANLIDLNFFLCKITIIPDNMFKNLM